MHYWNTVHDCAVAPSPIVPTYRPDPPLKRRNSTMSSSTAGSVRAAGPRALSTARPEARSAGMAERPTRNESLSDLVAFLQSQNMAASTTNSPAALPAVDSPGKTQPVGKEQVKPFHRRLLQFTQRQKKDSSAASSKSKADDQRRQIEALQREGYLVSGSKPNPSSRSTRSKPSIDSSLSQSKQKDVESIGQPWLAKEAHKHGPELPGDSRRRLASLDFGDFGSIGDMTISLSADYDDLSPPPYQPSVSSVPHRMQNSASQSTSALPLEKASMEARKSQNTNRPMSPPTHSTEGHSRRPSTSTGCSIRTDERGDTSYSQPVSRSTSLRVSESSDSSAKSDSITDRETQKRTQATGRLASNPSGSPPKPMKLFPNVTPPRGSSKNAWRVSAVPQYQKPSSKTAVLSDARSEVPESVNSGGNDVQQTGKSSSNESEGESKLACSGTNAAPRASTQSSTTAEPTAAKNSTQSQAAFRSSSLAMGTLNAFPLPAPTKPLPSIPQGRGPGALPDVRSIRPGPKNSVKNPSQPPPIAEDPREFLGRPATALGYAGEQDAADDYDSLQSRSSLERPKSTEPEQYTRRRASSFRMPRMHDLHECPGERDSDQPSEGQPIADSPVLGQKSPPSPTKSDRKRAARKGLQINTHANRRHLPFGLPSPPPTAALPSDPPTQPPSECSVAHRNYTAPAEPASVRGLDIAFQGGSRASVISRSNSSQSSLRHESIPETQEPDDGESPLPSSDDEGFGPASATIRSRRIVEQQNLRAMPPRRGFETLKARASQGRLRYSHSFRPETPQDHGADKLPSPQSEYSQSTYHSIDPRDTLPRGSRAANFLEDRVANLERQNQILQAALLAALNAGVKTPLESLQDSAVSPTFPPAGLGHSYQSRYASRPESWVSSARSSEHSGCETPNSFRENRAKLRQLDNMIEDIESGWLSEKSSLIGTRITHKH